MPTLRYAIDSRPARRGATEWERSLKQVERSTLQAERVSANLQARLDRFEGTGRRVRTSLAGLFAGVGVGVGARLFTQTSDSVTALENRLRLLTDTESDLLDVQRELFDSAFDTRTAYEATAEVYARTALNASDLGRSQQELLQFTRTLNQAVRVSGATATEANAALIQLSQGIASGELRGEELRSVTEQLPFVANIIQDFLGVSRAGLRELAQDGQVTADVVVDAILGAADRIDRDFQSTTLLVDEALGQVGTRGRELLQEFNRSTGATEGLARGIQGVANNLETVAAISAVVGTRIITGLGSRGVQAMQSASLASQELAQNRLLEARAEEASAAASAKSTAATVADTRAEVQRLTVLRSVAGSEAERLIIGQQIAGLEGQLAAEESAVTAGRTRLAVATEGVVAAERDLGRSRGLLTAGSAARGFLAALGGVPGAITTAGAAVLLFQPQLQALADRLRGVTEEERKLREESEALFESASRFGQLRGAFQNAFAGDEQRLRLAQRARELLTGQLDELARLQSQGLETVGVDTLLQFDPGAVERFTRQTLRQFADSIADDASLDEAREALGAIFDFSGEAARTQIIGRDAVDIPATGFFREFPRLLAEAGGNLAALDFSELRPFLALREVPIADAAQILLGTLGDIEVKVGKVQERLEESAESTRDLAEIAPPGAAASPDQSGVLRFLLDLEQVSKSNAELEIAAARREALVRAIGDEVTKRERLLDIQQAAEDAVRKRFEKEAAQDIRNLVTELERELEIERALGEQKNRLVAIDEVRRAAISAGIENVSAFVEKNEDLVRVLSDVLNAEADLQQKRRDGDRFVNETEARLREGRNERLGRERAIQAEIFQGAGRVAGGFLDPIRAAIQSGETDDLGRQLGISLFQTAADIGFDILQSILQNLASSALGGATGGIGGLLGIGASQRGNVIGPRGIVESRMGNVIGPTGVVPHRLGGLPGLGDLPEVGSEPAFFAMPGGGVGSIREERTKEVIAPLMRSVSGEEGVRLVGTNEVLPVARGADQRLGVMLTPRLMTQIFGFQTGGVPGGGSVPSVSSGSSAVGAAKGSLEKAVSEGVREGVRGTERRAARRSSRDRSGARPNTFRNGERGVQSGWGQRGPARL